MIAPFIITLREVFEIMLIIGIVYSFLIKTKNKNLLPYLYGGVLSSILLTMLSFFLLIGVYKSIDERDVEIFEGATMIIGALLITTFIIWMKNSKINLIAEKTSIFLIPMLSILREGVEIILFLFSLYFVEGYNIVFPSFIGIISGITIGYLSIKGLMKINLKLFLNVTGILLILFSAGLIARGINELQEAKVLPTIKEKVWDLNPKVVGDEYPILHENGIVGSFLKGMFGYNGDPSLIEVLVYSGYLISVSLFWKKSV